MDRTWSSVAGGIVAEVARTRIPLGTNVLGAPRFDAASLVYDHKRIIAALPRLPEERRKAAVALTHLWRCQNNLV